MPLIDGIYSIKSLLGKGSFGEVYDGENRYNYDPVAIKIETQDSDRNMLKHEYDVYRRLADDNATGIPKCLWFGNKGGRYLLIMEKLGPSLEKLFSLCGQRFSLKTVLYIGIQILYRLEYIHSRGLIHRDIKPDNFLIGILHKRNTIYLIDYGLAKLFQVSNKHIPYREGKRFVGNARYASVNSHKGFELARRDDLESLGYMLVYFLQGSLPWQGLGGHTKDEKRQRILDSKANTSIKTLCKDLKSEFIQYFEHVHALKFPEKPNYRYFKSLLISLFRKQGFVDDGKYDWSDLLASQESS